MEFTGAAVDTWIMRTLPGRPPLSLLSLLVTLPLNKPQWQIFLSKGTLSFYIMVHHNKLYSVFRCGSTVLNILSADRSLLLWSQETPFQGNRPTSSPQFPVPSRLLMTTLIPFGLRLSTWTVVQQIEFTESVWNGRLIFFIVAHMV